MSIGERIKKIRKEKDLTMEKFGDSLGVRKSAVSNWENGKNVPNNMIKAICEKYNINEDWLRTGNGSMKKEIDLEFGDICAYIGANDEKAKEAIVKYYELAEDDKKLWWAYVERFMK